MFQCWFRATIDSGSEAIVNALYLRVRMCYRHVYFSTVLFMVAFPERLRFHMCPETLLMDLLRLKQLQSDFAEMTEVFGRCALACLHGDARA